MSLQMNTNKSHTQTHNIIMNKKCIISAENAMCWENYKRLQLNGTIYNKWIKTAYSRKWGRNINKANEIFVGKEIDFFFCLDCNVIFVYVSLQLSLISMKHSKRMNTGGGGGDDALFIPKIVIVMANRKSKTSTLPEIVFRYFHVFNKPQCKQLPSDVRRSLTPPQPTVAHHNLMQ